MYVNPSPPPPVLFEWSLSLVTSLGKFAFLPNATKFFFYLLMHSFSILEINFVHFKVDTIVLIVRNTYKRKSRLNLF